MQADDYYAFGLAFNSYSSGLKNHYLYNGKEMQDELDLGWYDYGARMYDAAAARWFVSDPMADLAHSWTPYRYGFNNPLMYTDPTGMFEYSDGYSTKDTKYETGSVSHSGSFTGNAGDLEKGTTAGTTVTAQVNTGSAAAASTVSSTPTTSDALEGTSTGQGEVAAQEAPESPADVIYITMLSIPANFDFNAYKKQLQNKLIDEGFSERLKVEEYSIFSVISSYLRGDNYAKITFQPPSPRDITGKRAGHATPWSNIATIVTRPGYSQKDYVHSSVHELGHAIFGFKHLDDINNIMYPYSGNSNATFNDAQRKLIANSEWGK